MMIGTVNDVLQPKLHLDLQSGDATRRSVEAMIDTGFNGFLALPVTLIDELSLPWLYRHHGELADGSVQIFDVYEATLEWDGVTRAVEAEAIRAEPLLGMSLMENYELRIEVRENGPAKLALLS